MNIDRLKELLAISVEEIGANKNLKNELTDYYKFIYGVAGCSSCKDKFQKYYKRLMVDGIEKLSIKVESNFKLRNDIGVMQINFGNGEFISPSNATDALCIEFLKANPNRISLFSEFPDNWKMLIQNNIKEDENE